MNRVLTENSTDTGFNLVIENLLFSTTPLLDNKKDLNKRFNLVIENLLFSTLTAEEAVGIAINVSIS